MKWLRYFEALQGHQDWTQPSTLMQGALIRQKHFKDWQHCNADCYFQGNVSNHPSWPNKRVPSPVDASRSDHLSQVTSSALINTERERERELLQDSSQKKGSFNKMILKHTTESNAKCVQIESYFCTNTVVFTQKCKGLVATKVCWWLSCINTEYSLTDKGFWRQIPNTNICWF